MSTIKINNFTIREINPNSTHEIELIASRMRQTLIEVLGDEKGSTMYSMEWLRDRVLWHLDETKTKAKVLIAEMNDQIVGHAIARVELGDQKQTYGYFSTLFVETESRNKGVATSLMGQVDNWFLDLGMPKIIYNTAENNHRLIKLFRRYGYEITATQSEMVQLTKTLTNNVS